MLAILKGLEIDQLPFHRSPQAFNEDVVMAPTSTIHADLNLCLLNLTRKDLSCQLGILNLLDSRWREMIPFWLSIEMAHMNYVVVTP